VRLLPAALAVLEAVCELLPEPMRIARGGVREGLALERSRQPAEAETS
jgi:exopolyphosphatase/pppGpp-phosphohydrolase